MSKLVRPLWDTGSMLECAHWKERDGLLLRLVASKTGLRRVEFDSPGATEIALPVGNPVLIKTSRQLEAYFAGDLREFTIPLEMEGTEFQKRVWQALLTIPYGETRTYREQAQAIGSASAVRAVGAANGANPLAIIVPCHRVIGSSGKLVGYGGGLALKKRLLQLEGAAIGSTQRSLAFGRGE